MKIYILYHRLYDLNGEQLTIGGIQTYILNLANILHKNGYQVEIYQNANMNWTKEYGDFNITGIYCEKSKYSYNVEELYKYILKYSKSDDLIIFGTDSEAVKCTQRTTIAIQHGISFDIITSGGWKRELLVKLGLESLLYKKLRKQAVQDFLKTNYQVCVDYNFLNWIRTMVPRINLEKTRVIPNFTYINNTDSVNFNEENNIHILFARRFVEQRGVYILAELVDEILARHNNVFFTIAGTGPLEKFLKNKFLNNSKVTFTTFAQEDSLKIHSKYHISLIPTLGSEGTSLSLLESMTSGCVPVVSNVGGMTNIILNGFNGYIVNPISNEFIEKVDILIKNKAMRQTMSINAKNSVDNSFSFENWKSKWLDLIEEIKNQIK